jgi:CBS domain-containing protein
VDPPALDEPEVAVRISDVVQSKSSRDVITISPDASVRDLLSLLAEHNVGALVVSSDGRRLEGIVSERDVVRRLHEDDAILDGAVSAIMTTEVTTCEPHAELHEIRRTMTDRRIRHIPVVEDHAVVGIISIGDVVAQTLKQLEFERDQLDNYVHQT